MKVLAWIVGVFFALAALASIAQGEVVAFIALLIPAFLVLPPSSKLIKFKMHWVVKLIIIFICIGLSSVRVTEKGKAEMAEQKEKARIEAEAKEKKKAEEEAKKPKKIKLKDRSALIDNVDFYIKSYYWADSIDLGDKKLTPKNKFLVIEVTAINYSKIPEDTILYLVDSKKKTYEVKNYLYVEDKNLLNYPMDVLIPNGKGNTNELVFDVPVDERYSLYIGVKRFPQNKKWAAINWEQPKQK